MRGAFYAGAGAEGRQYAPAIVRYLPAVNLFKKAGYVAVGGYLFSFGAVKVKHGPRHAHRPEYALVQKLLKRHAGGRVYDIGYNGIAFVGIAHVFARRADGLIAAVGYVIYDLLYLVHLVWRRAAHLKRPLVAFVYGGVALFAYVLLGKVRETIHAVHGYGPFKRLHGRYACRVHGKVLYKHRISRIARYTEGGYVLDYRVFKAEPALSLQYGKSKR